MTVFVIDDLLYLSAITLLKYVIVLNRFIMRKVILIFIIFLSNYLFADSTAKTDDGRKALLKSDGTWEWEKGEKIIYNISHLMKIIFFLSIYGRRQIAGGVKRRVVAFSY